MQHPREYFTILGIIVIIELSYIIILSYNHSLITDNYIGFFILFLILAAGVNRIFYIFEN